MLSDCCLEIISSLIKVVRFFPFVYHQVLKKNLSADALKFTIVEKKDKQVCFLQFPPNNDLSILNLVAP